MENNSDTTKTNLSSSASHQRVQKSTTLNRKYVKKPGKETESALIDSVAKRRAEDLKRRQALAEKINRERISALKSGKSLKAADKPNSVKITSEPAPIATPPAPNIPAEVPEAPKPLAATIEKNLVSSSAPEKPTKDIKEKAVQAALKSVEMVEADKEKNSAPISTKHSIGAKKILLAFGCAAIAVGIIGYFVSTNTPDLSVRVAAMQSGIEAAYPSYVPRGYSLTDIVSAEGKLDMTFTNSENGSFVLSEEKSSWDNETLESSYAKETWGQNYTSIREQGITIFISGSDAAWVNGGIVYKLTASGNNLTKKQIKSIVTSL